MGLMDLWFLFMVMKIFKNCGDGCIMVSILKSTELYILNEWIVWYVNYTSLKLFLKFLGI